MGMPPWAAGPADQESPGVCSRHTIRNKTQGTTLYNYHKSPSTVSGCGGCRLGCGSGS